MDQEPPAGQATPGIALEDADLRPARTIGSVQDMADRRLAGEQLQYANLLQKTQMDASPDGIMVADANRRIVVANRAFFVMWDIDPAELDTEDHDPLRARMTAQVKDPVAYAARAQYLHDHPDESGDDEIETLDGRIIHRFSVPLRLPSGAHVGRVRYFRDITERRTAEAKLQFANLVLRTQMEASPDGILVVDANRQMISFNRRFADIWEIPLENLANPDYDSIRARMAALVRSPVEYSTRATFLAEHPKEVANDEIEMADGRLLERFSRSLTCGDTGEELGRVWFFSDITDRHAAGQKLQVANLLLRAQMDASPDGILVVDTSGHITSFNRRFGEIWQVPQSALRAGEDGPVLAHVISQVKDPESFAARVSYLYNNPGEISDDEIETVDGRVFERHSVPLPTYGGEYLGRAWFFGDITERKQAAAILEYRDRLLQAVTAATSLAVTAVSLDEGVPDALRQIGECMNVQRVMVFQNMRSQLAMRFVWVAPQITTKLTLSGSADHRFDEAELVAWRRPLKDGRPVFADATTATGAVLDMLSQHNIKSLALMPVYVDGYVWGFISVDDCIAPRRWTASEVETLGILARVAGSLIVRERARIGLETSESRFRLLTATAKDAVILSGPDGEILQWNQAAERIFGYTAAEAMGRKLVDLLVRPQEREMVIRGMTGASADLSATVEFTFLKKDGSEVPTEVSVSAMPLGAEHGILCILRDISGRKEAEATLLFANIMLKTQMEASPDGVLAVSADRRVVSYNQRFSDMWNVPVALLEAGDAAAVLTTLMPLIVDPEAFMDRMRFLMDHPSEPGYDEFETTDGRFIERHSLALRSNAIDNLGRVWFLRDVTARRAAEALALRLARFDVLTGLANRAVFVEAVKQAIAFAKRGSAGFAVLYLDLDHFKDVNDTLGHPVGDELLKEVAARLRGNTRVTDTIGRFGGDEFAVVATGIDDPADAAVLAEKLVKAIAAPFAIAGNIIHVGASIGIDLHSPRAADTETLLSHADVALYRAKTEGRATYRFFTATMDHDVHQRVALSGELREAMARDQLFLVYQPQIAAVTGRITGVEALLRWRHPTRGLLAPEDFVPLAESIGLIAMLGHFVLWTAFRQGKAWLNIGLPPIRISVNVSALQFKAALVLETDIIGALNETGLPPNLLELELTQTALMGASREHNNVLLRFRQLGVKLLLDDFGTGDSSLDYLRLLPVDHIKIAQALIKNVETEAGDASIVRAVLGLAHVLRISVIADGIATRAQLELLRSWGCSDMQGVYFARPMPAEVITDLLQSGGTIQAPPTAGEP